MHINTTTDATAEMLMTYHKAGVFRDAKTWHKFTIRDSFNRLLRAACLSTIVYKNIMQA